MDMVANAAPVEIARWRSGDLEERPEAASEQDGDGGALGTSASKQSLFAAAGLEGAAGNGGVSNSLRLGPICFKLATSSKP